MCTIILRHGIDEWCSQVIASNRDEFYDRQATAPQVLRTVPRIVGGRDEREGGTWFAFTPSGLFLGLTNQRNFGPRDGSARSRGELVVAALAAGSLEGIKRFLGSVDPADYNEFNLIFGDGTDACAAYGRRDSNEVEIEALSAGVHVLCNDRLGSDEFPKAARAEERVARIAPGPWPELRARLIDVLSDRSLPDLASVPPLPPNAPFDAEVARRLQAICVETPVYGTVSATLAAIAPGRIERYEYSDGPPAPDRFQDVAGLTRSGA